MLEPLTITRSYIMEVMTLDRNLMGHKCDSIKPRVVLNVQDGTVTGV